nr:hypothetical protein [Bacteroidota bacterium]
GITFSRTFNYSAKGNSVSQTTDEGYIIAGNSGLLKTDKVGNEEWYREYGSGGVGYSVAETKDGGYITTGGNDYNVFLIKTDADGNLLWNKSLTGEVGFSVQQTIDDGYIVCGKIYTDAIWWYDMILIKTDSYGNEIWSQTFGSGLVDEAYCVEQTLDGGYIITGEKDAGDYQNTNTKMWLIKTDPDGNIEWDYEHSGGSHHHGQSVQQTRDGGFIVAGQSGSNMSLFKIISNGSLDWTNTYSGTYSSLGYDVRQTTDEGYIVTGRINSAEEGPSNVDVYIIKTDDSGSLHWERVFGNGSYDAGYSAEQTSDSGYIVVGENNGQIWLIKTDPEGNVY